ncbi:uncharacterized protein LOC135207704 [Macrobrachium nipponense]|uniref:uncharacterized protein LOC135207704 n=1 Tax=Macrobrachium nipponense TaxID=159736 RepID=UPI0030C868AE
MPEFKKQIPAHVEDASVSETDDHLDWRSVGKVVKLEELPPVEDEPVFEKLEESDDVSSDNTHDDGIVGTPSKLIDASEPSGISDDACAEVLNVMNTTPLGLRHNLLKMNLELPSKRRGCFKSRDSDCRTPGNSLCNGPLYVVYEGFRFCCPTSKHPLLERSGNHIRCSC